MSKEVPFFLKSVADADEALYELVDMTLDLVHQDGALEAKYKYLLSMVADALCNHPNGAVACARDAMAAGATREQVVEAMRIVFSAGGLPLVLENAGVYGVLED